VDDPDAALIRSLYDEHAAALWRDALRLTGDRARAEDVVQETLLRAWRHPEVADDSERSARAWLFTVARNMISTSGAVHGSATTCARRTLPAHPSKPARMR
jgi:RNA polymerase sigma-70 factor (ECF subfamily)